MNRNVMGRAIAVFLPLAVLLTVAVGLMYGAVQQVYRTSADDPQLQIATDEALRLDAGARPASIVGGATVDLAESLAVHSSVYDRAGNVLASDARLDGAPPVPPAGVLDSAVKNGKNVLTWQPQGGVRVAAVVMGWKGGTVLVGRSLGPIEDRESSLELLLGGGWVLGLLALAGASLLSGWLWQPRTA